MVTKKKRRSQLARASLQRQQVRRAQRQAHRRRVRIVLTLVAAVLLTAGIAAWIVLHDSGSESTRATGVDYASVVDQTLDHAPTAEGVR